MNKPMRLSPEQRSAEILDAAASVITNEGMSAISMERLGREAGISKALVYNYFANRNELLIALLERGQKLLRKNNVQIAANAETLEELIRGTLHSYLLAMREKGELLQRLNSEPHVVAEVRERNKDKLQDTVRYLAERLRSENPQLSQKESVMAVRLAMGISDASAKYLYQNETDYEEVEHMCIEMIMAALASVKSNSRD